MVVKPVTGAITFEENIAKLRKVIDDVKLRLAKESPPTASGTSK